MSQNTDGTPSHILGRLEYLTCRRHQLLHELETLDPNCVPLVRRSIKKELRCITRLAQKIASDALSYHSRPDVRTAIITGKENAYQTTQNT